MEDHPYIISRRPRRSEKYRDPRRPKRAAGVLVIVLLLLTAGICALVWLLPGLTETAGGSPSFGGKTFYFLATAKTDERVEALTAAQAASDRGGAGHIYNDGEYRVIAAVYDRESDVKTLVSVNADSHYFALEYPKLDCDERDRRALEYLTGEWFSSVFAAVTELDRGNITDAAAERAVFSCCRRLEKLAYDCADRALQNALLSAVELDGQASRSTLSFLRLIHVKAIVYAYIALTD